MRVRLNLVGEHIGPQLDRKATKWKQLVNEASRGAAEDVVEYVVPRARQDIAQAGNFSKWAATFKGKTTEGGGNIRVTFTMGTDHPIKHWRVFEFGATIRGKPLLWIPLSFAADARGKRARDFPGKLFRVDRKAGGAPLLLGGNPATPKYFGKASVNIPKKFHLREIIRQGAKQLKLFYSNRRQGQNG